MKVLEVNGNRVLVEDLNAMALHGTSVYLKSDLMDYAEWKKQADEK